MKNQSAVIALVIAIGSVFLLFSDGQEGKACKPDGSCDQGLVCTKFSETTKTCQPSGYLTDTRLQSN